MRELSLNILDIVQNSISAKATVVKIDIIYSDDNRRMSIEITDDGCGMTQEQLDHVTDPFFTTRKTRKVGLGIPLFKMAAELTGGGFRIASQKGKGTYLKADFVLDNVDMLPLGDMKSTILILIRCNPDIDFVYTVRKNGEENRFDTRELRTVLEDVPLNNQDVLNWIGGYFDELF